jgi:sodium transport system ATP-binding protein
MAEVLRVESLTKEFYLSKKQQKIEKTDVKRKVAVNDVSFKVEEGIIYGLLGPNGAGKTTILRALSTLIKPTSGDAFIYGASVISQPDLVRKNIAFLTSELKLEDFFSPNYLFTFFGNLHGLSPELIEERKNILFSKFGIDKFAEVKVANLSTGMKQKLSIAIALVQDPKLIIFDEPTNGLDVLTAKVVTDYLLELKQEGKTIILSTHIFSLVEKLCDNVGIIINGKIIKDSNLKELIGENRLEDVFFELYKKEVGTQE